MIPVDVPAELLEEGAHDRVLRAELLERLERVGGGGSFAGLRLANDEPQRGEGLPGRVWRTGKPEAIPDIEHSEATFYRRSAMREHDIGNVLIGGDEGAVGIITDRDIVVRALAEGCGAEDKIGPYVSTDLFTVSQDDMVDEVARTMAARKVRRVPVVDDNTFQGILSIGDLAEDYAPDSVLGDISEAPPNN